MDNLIPLTDVPLKFHIQESELNRLISSGKIRIMNLSGNLLISEESILMNLPKEEREEYRQFLHLKGVGIALREAGREYNIPSSTIRSWILAGYIKKLGYDGQKVKLDRADVAYCAYIYHKKSGSRGKWIFGPDGTPYVPKENK